MSLFYYHKNHVSMFILVYVDDIIVASSTQEGITTLLQDLKKDFSLKDIGDLHYFLGIEVNKTRDGLVLTQEKYVADLLKKYDMANCKPVSTPLCTSEKLSLHQGYPLGTKDATQYRSLLGALQYLTLSTSIGLRICRSSSTLVSGYSDADWVGCLTIEDPLEGLQFS
jgi:hypothetical protein